MEAAFKGSKEVGFTIMSMTLSLVAVFIPVLFMGGVVGRMFNEFGLVISIAILISGIVSLTLTPMLCSRLLKPIDHHEKHNCLLRCFEWSFNRLTDGYALGAAPHRGDAAARARDHARHLRADRHPVPGDSQGLLPGRRISARSAARRSARTTPRSTPWWRARRCWPRSSSAIPTSSSVISTVGGGNARRPRSIRAASSSPCATSRSARPARCR